MATNTHHYSVLPLLLLPPLLLPPLSLVLRLLALWAKEGVEEAKPEGEEEGAEEVLALQLAPLWLAPELAPPPSLLLLLSSTPLLLALLLPPPLLLVLAEHSMVPSSLVLWLLAGALLAGAALLLLALLAVGPPRSLSRPSLEVLAEQSEDKPAFFFMSSIPSGRKNMFTSTSIAITAFAPPEIC